MPDTVQYRSLNPIIADVTARHREQLYFAFMSWHRSLRYGRYKLIEYCVDGERETQLFDLQDDPAEIENLAAAEAMQPTLARLRDRLASERKRLNDGNSEASHTKQMSEEFWSTYDMTARE